jgi:GGDEF domain-containing protein
MSSLDGFASLIFNVYEAFTVALYVKENKSLKCLSSVTFANSFDKHKNIPVEGTLPGWVIKHGAPLIIPNFDKDEDALGYYSAPEGIKSFMGYPIEGKGVIVVDSKKKWVFTDKEKKILGAFATAVDQEMEKEKRFNDLEERVEELLRERRIIDLFNEMNLSKVSLAEMFEECMDLSGADCCFTGIEKGGKVFVHDLFGISPDGYAKKECSSEGSISSTVVERGRELLLPHNSGLLREKPLFFPGEAIKAKQFFGFPLIKDDMAIGVLGFISRSDKPLREQSIGILRNLSTLLSLYYSSLWLKDNLERLKDFEPVTDSIQFPIFLAILDNLIKKKDRFSLLSVKLTNVLAFNRQIGLQATNGLLKKIFQIIRYCVGAQAFITRRGGGHFYVLLRGDERVEVKSIVRILNYTVGKGIAEEELSDITGSLETGVASFPEEGMTDLWDLLEKAEGRKARSSKK